MVNSNEGGQISKIDHPVETQFTCSLTLVLCVSYNDENGALIANVCGVCEMCVFVGGVGGWED